MKKLNKKAATPLCGGFDRGATPPFKNSKSQNWFESLGYALSGIRQTITQERNFRIQIFLGIVAVITCIIFRVDAMHFFMVAFAIFFVLCMELMNTAIEALTDLACGGKQHPLAKLAKDVAAGAVLLASVFALVVGAIVAMSIIGRYV